MMVLDLNESPRREPVEGRGEGGEWVGVVQAGILLWLL